MGDFQKNEDFSFSENNLNIKWYERKVNILKQAQWYSLFGDSENRENNS